MKLPIFEVLFECPPEKCRPTLEKHLVCPPSPLYGFWTIVHHEATWVGPPFTSCCSFRVTSTPKPCTKRSKIFLIDYLWLNRPEILGSGRPEKYTIVSWQEWISVSVCLPSIHQDDPPSSLQSQPSGKWMGRMTQPTRSSRNLNLQGKNVRMENDCCWFIPVQVLKRPSLSSPIFRTSKLSNFLSKARSRTIHPFPSILRAAL